MIKKFGENYKFYNTRIKVAELGQIILRGIRADGTIQDEIVYMELIENGLEKCKISPNMIKLGTNRAGTKIITLSDILPREKDKI